MNDSNQYMVQVGSDFDQNTYIIQDANGLPVQYEGGTLIQGDLSDGNNLMSENRWIQQTSGRGGKLLNSQNYLNGDLVNGTGLNLNTRYTPSSIVLNSSTTGTQFDQDNLRISTAVTGAGGRGRPRGRKPSRGNFPVVPIDMVRQLGIEQQVILQPTVPVAMKNKTTMCKPLLMSKKTQCNENDLSGLNNTSSETTIKYIYTPVFVPVPVPVYVPIPTFVKLKNAMKDNEATLPSIATVHETIEEVCIDQPEILQEKSFCTDFTKAIETIQLLNTSEEPLTIASNETEVIKPIKTEMETESKKRPFTDEDFTMAKHRKLEPCLSEKKDVDSCKLKYSFGINAWRHWSKNSNILLFSVTEINTHLVEFVQKIRKPTNEVYVPDSILYLCLGIQLFLYDHNYDLNLFVDPRMESFQLELNKILATFKPKLSDHQVLVCRIEEEHLWESQQLGVSRPGVLIFSVCYLLTKQLKMKAGLEHSELKLSQLEVTESAIVFRSMATSGDGVVVCEKSSNINRCFYTILRTYIDKCATRRMAINEVADNEEGAPQQIGEAEEQQPHLYLTALETEDTALLDLCPWYDNRPVDVVYIDMMLNRIRIVKEVQESLLSSSI